MNIINLISKMAKKLGDKDFEGFRHIQDDKTYGFKDVGDDTWEDDGSGKYQYKYEQGQLIEIDENDKEKESFNFGITRSIQRCGSYFSGYNFEPEQYNICEIKEVLIPEKIIPAYVENKWNILKVNLGDVIDEEEEREKNLEAERIRLEKEAELEKERLSKLYPMNKQEIIKMVNKNLKKKGVTMITIGVMRKEYFDIVVAKKLESQEWIDYHRELQSKISQ